MQEKDINMIPQGFITGIPGGILNECILREIQGVSFLAKANHRQPDPMAAATLVEAVNRAYQTNIDTQDLKNQKEKLGVDFKELSDKYAEDRKTDAGMYM
jgi:uncharacterized protein